ncbi:hypothetical protein Tco_0027714, partial [Tanacetum coccineum]
MLSDCETDTSPMTSDAGNENCLGWAARDPSGFLSPYRFDR